MPSDTLHLEQRYRTWYCVLAVPKAVQGLLGKRHLVRSLKTHDLTEAQRRRHKVLADFHCTLDAARKTLAAGPDDLMVWAAELRRADGYQDPETGLSATEIAELSIEQIEKDYGPEKASAFWKVATGTGTPISHHVEGWLAESTYPHRSQTQHRGTVTELEAFCKAQGTSPEVEKITRQVAGKWAAEALKDGQKRPTVQRKLSTFRVYWEWMVARDMAAGNPWAEIKLPKQKLQNPDDDVRGFTDGELIALLNGGADPVLLDFMRIAALTGARLESIAQLTVGACHGKVFFIKQDKSKAGTRRVPIHSELQPLVDRRCKDRVTTDWLFPELITRASGSRSAAISTRFNRYRMDLEIDEKRPDRRGSLVNFHSFRHWFITAALRARQPEAVVDQVIGHASKSLARRVYFDGDLEAELRACVESVKLPRKPAGAAAGASPVQVPLDQVALA